MTRPQPVTTPLSPRYQWSANEYQGMLRAGVFDEIKLLDGDVVITGAACKPYRWTLDDYEQLVALGMLEDKRVELVRGEILVLSPMGEPHAPTITQLNESLSPYCNSRTGCRLRIQMPLALPSLTSEPERCLVVYRHPVPDPQFFSAWRYQDCQVFHPAEQVAPLVAPEIVVPVAAVFPA